MAPGEIFFNGSLTGNEPDATVENHIFDKRTPEVNWKLFCSNLAS